MFDQLSLIQNTAQSKSLVDLFVFEHPNLGGANKFFALSQNKGHHQKNI